MTNEDLYRCYLGSFVRASTGAEVNLTVEADSDLDDTWRTKCAVAIALGVEHAKNTEGNGPAVALMSDVIEDIEFLLTHSDQGRSAKLLKIDKEPA